MMMNLLRDKSKNIQFEAFHVFKVRFRPNRHLGVSENVDDRSSLHVQVFVANPKKPPQIEGILRRNKEKLLVFLRNFHNDKEGPYRVTSSLIRSFKNSPV
jgi:calcium binding protein 39